MPTGDEDDFAVWVYERMGGRWVISASRMLAVILAFDWELGQSPVNPPSWVWNLAG